MGITIKDVAREAGTSIATVSKVMNGSYSISEETTVRVLQVMDKLNYHPNQRARNFAKQTNRSVAFITEIERNAGFQNPHMFEMMSGMEHMLAKKGYAFIVKSISRNDAPAYVKDAFETKMADGFIIHASVISSELNDLIAKEEIPHLVIGVPEFESDFCWIDVDNRHAGQAAAKHLLVKGYQSVAFIGGTEDDKISMHRLEGVLSVLKEHDVVQPRNYVQYGKSVAKDGYEMTKQLMTEKKRPDAIVCANNYLAYGCVQALHDMKLSIPKDVGVITFDDYPFSQLLDPMLTVVNIDVYDIGQEAGKMILQKINKPNLHIQSYITYPDVIERDST